MSFNLARKLRPKDFDTVIGQDLIKRMLKNSLYLDRLFPAYLFAGQRGCGKTTMARIFAKALNCSVLEKFRQRPQENSVPCLACDSCQKMDSGQHPDFLELDAASHTGVENIRQILESANYQPILGKTKIYLIDEVHMLSKSAFNALLKILEEPPATALFILATTEIEKVPVTVRSRCFLGIFKAIDREKLHGLLSQICSEQKLEFEAKALDLIIKQSQGSARDAINLLEQVILYSDQKKLSQSLVREVFGFVESDFVVRLVEFAIKKDKKALTEVCAGKSFFSSNPTVLYQNFMELFSSILKLKFDFKIDEAIFFDQDKQLKNIANFCSLDRVRSVMQILYEDEKLFLSTKNKHLFLEYLLLKIASQAEVEEIKKLLTLNNDKQSEQPVSKPSIQKKFLKEAKVSDAKPSEIVKPAPEKERTEGSELSKPVEVEKAAELGDLPESWQKVLDCPDIKKDPILSSIFLQVKNVQVCPKTKALRLLVPVVRPFLEEKIKETVLIWKKSLKEAFPEAGSLRLVAQRGSVPDLAAKNIAERKKKSSLVKENKVVSKKKIVTSNNLDKEKWPKTCLILEHLPGKVEIEDSAS